MVQKLINDREENKFFNVWLQLFQQTMSDLQDYYNLVYESNLLGALIFDNQLSEIAKIINRELFIKTYWQIFNEETKNGTVDAHLYILYAIFGSNATIYVDQVSPLYVRYLIQTNTITLNNWLTKQGDQMVTKNGDRLMFRSILSGLTNAELTNAELENLLKATANYGEYLDFEIETDVDENDFGFVNQFAGIHDDYGLVTQTPEIFADYGEVTQPTA